MGGWLDRWAKRAAEAAPPAAQDELSRPQASAGSSRRDFLKKAGVVGGVAWSVPVLQTVMAPAASASVNTPLGGLCSGTGACANNTAFCNGTTCGGLGATCTTTCAPSIGCSVNTGTCGGGGSPASKAAPCPASSGTTYCYGGTTCTYISVGQGWRCQ